MSKDSDISVLRAKRLRALESNAELAWIHLELDTFSSYSSAPKNNAPPSLDQNLFRSDGNIHSLAPPRGRPGGKGSSTVLEGEDLYCRLPSEKISGDQLYQFLRIQFGVEIEPPKIKVNNAGNSFCFIKCTEKDRETLLQELSVDKDVTVPDGEGGDLKGTLVVKENIENHNRIQ